jgi:hypothetical protein
MDYDECIFERDDGDVVITLGLRWVYASYYPWIIVAIKYWL